MENNVKNNHRKKGFTLIELLVVVLIIGILAAIALPKYQRAVEKSRTATVLPLLKNVGMAQMAYRMANGNYATSFDELDIGIPWQGNEPWRDSTTPEGAVKDTRSNGEWSLQIVNGHTLFLGRISGPYAGVGFAYLLPDSPYFRNGQDPLVCAERKGTGVIYSGANGSFCGKVIPVSSQGYRDSSLHLWNL